MTGNVPKLGDIHVSKSYDFRSKSSFWRVVPWFRFMRRPAARTARQEVVVKGTITACLKELVVAKFSEEKWQAILSDCGLAKKNALLQMMGADIPDNEVSALLASTCKVLGLSIQQAADAFGEYWCCVYAPRIYKAFYTRFKSAREMIVGMDEIHVATTNQVPNAHPPRFAFKWENDRTLVVDYKSKRNLIDIYIGLTKGVGIYFKETLTVTKLSSSQIRIVFG
jgi:hypothetical protein